MLLSILLLSEAGFKQDPPRVQASLRLALSRTPESPAGFKQGPPREASLSILSEAGFKQDPPGSRHS